MKTARLATLAALLLAGTVALTGCSQLMGLIADNPPVRDADTSEITEGGDLDVFTLSVGDCFDDQSATEVSEVPVVPCTQPHDNEVFHDFTVDGEEFDQATIDAAAEENCGGQFDVFTGIAYDQSVLDWSTLAPTPGSWEQGDRLVSCIIYEYGVRTVGTLAGAQR